MTTGRTKKMPVSQSGRDVQVFHEQARNCIVVESEANALLEQFGDTLWELESSYKPIT